jgi:hypothetical protein
VTTYLSSNKLSPEELTFALNQAREWVSIGALEVVSAPPLHVLVSNVVIAYRSGIMNRVCWAGNAVKGRGSSKPFQNGFLACSGKIKRARKGDWMFRFGLNKGYFQIPPTHSDKEFTYMRIGEYYFRRNVC